MSRPLPALCYVAICANNPAACGYPEGDVTDRRFGFGSLSISDAELDVCVNLTWKVWEAVQTGLDCGNGVFNASEATALAFIYGSSPGEQNALQHCIFAAGLTLSGGQGFATKVLVAHERGYWQGTGDLRRDVWNNTYATLIVAQEPGLYTANCIRALKAGSLVTDPVNDPRIN
jgi:hypothetical protein